MTDPFQKVLDDPRVRRPLDEEEAHRIQSEIDWDKKLEPKKEEVAT